MSRFSPSQGHMGRIHDFSLAPQAKIQRSSFNRSHNHKTTFNAGYLIPIYVDEALPGDTFSCRLTAVARLATPLFPLMDNLYLDTFFFAVPYRLVWSNWEKFNGAQDNPADSTSFVIPTGTSPVSTGYAANSLQDYMGIPPGVAGIVHSNLHMRGYNLIYNQWFRDENLQNSVTVDTGNGPDTVSNYVLLQRGKRRDYFTSCLPWTQKINDGTSTGVGLAGNATVKSTGNNITYYDQHSHNGALQYSTSPPNHFDVNVGTFVNADLLTYGPAGTSTTGLVADLSTASAITINALRQAVQLQRFFERDARGGTRYTEIVKSHFGVVSPDARLQRAEFLGGGSTPVNINPIAVTSSSGITGGTLKTGDLAAFGIVHSMGNGFVKSFTEHCLILGLVSVRADYTYQQGTERFWFRSTRYDFFWPAFAHLGEQSVLNQEIYTQGTAGGSADVGVFGYQERYADYRYKPSRLSGEFRSSYSTPLDAWHLAQNFGSLPTLGSTFIVENPPMTRIKAVSSEPDFIMDARLDIKSARPMPMYGVPGGMDRF